MYVLRFYRLTGVDPGLKTAKERRDFLITVLQQEERRTGACVFIRSGTVGDDPLILVQTHTGWICFNIKQRNRQRAGNVAGLIRLVTAHIHDDRFTFLDGGCCFIHCHARHICFGNRSPLCQS